jgi:hypothetical protein
VNVQDERAARVHVFVPSFAGRMRSTNRTEISSYASAVFPAETSRVRIQIQASHHRAFHAGAVLSVVNALRFASTRPVAGPAGIDDASARHLFGNYAMVCNLSITRRGLTRESQAYVDIITSVPHGTPSVRRHGQRSAHSASAHRARHRAQPQTSQTDARRLSRFVGASTELRTSMLLAAHHPQDHAPRRGCVHQRHRIALV